jgi:type IV secretory pathway VirD2 relaxase
MSDLDELRPRLGRIRDRAAPRTFVGRALEAAGRAGGLARTRTKGCGRNGWGRGAALAAALRQSDRRVVVKVRVVRHAGRSYTAAPLAAHLRYLRRDGVDRTGAEGRMFDAEGEADSRAFAARCDGDRHHFRFIVAPEDAAELGDLRGYARELMRGVETDLGGRLDWIAVDHWNTAHPHLHVLVRGLAADGADLVIDGSYLSRGVRARAEALASLELGPRSAREIAAGLQRDAEAERWTRLDDLIAREAGAGRLDLRPGPGALDHDLRALLVGRAVTLERLGLAVADGPGVWRLHPEHRERLRTLAVRADIIATLHQAAGRHRALADLMPGGEGAAHPILGRLVARGLHDELTGEAFVAVDGVDGRLHHVRVPHLGAAGDTPAGGIVEVRPGEGAARVRHRSDLPLAAQVEAEGATWLDRQLVATTPSALARAGFGAEVLAALDARRDVLVARGLATRGPRGVTLAKDLLATLRSRDLERAGARIAAETGLAFRGEDAGPEVSGTYRRRVDLASGRFALVEDGLGFRLAPWAQVLDRRLGQAVQGVMHAGRMDWALSRDRNLSR